MARKIKQRFDTAPPPPVRGVPGGWRDWWDGPDPAQEARAYLDVVDRQTADREARIAANGPDEDEVSDPAWRETRQAITLHDR